MFFVACCRFRNFRGVGIGETGLGPCGLKKTPAVPIPSIDLFGARDAMKWFSILGVGLVCAWGSAVSVAATAAKPAAGACLVAEFKTLSLSLDDVVERAQQARGWLQKNISRCTSEQLSAIKGNSPSWLGHALTPELAGLIEGAIEAKISGNPALMGQLYESLGKEGSASVTTLKNPTPRAPIVPPQIIQGGLAGAVNYGNVVGPSTSIVNQTGNQNTNQNSQQFQGGWNNTQQQGMTAPMTGQ